MACPRCGRTHSGVCGIPGIGVRIGIGGVGIGGMRRHSDSSHPVHTKPKTKKTWLTKHGLEAMLSWGFDQEKICTEMLKQLSPEMPEYQQILERLDKVMATIEQVKKQISARK